MATLSRSSRPVQPLDEPLACGKRSLSAGPTDAWEMDRPMNGDGKARLVGIRAAVIPLLAAIVALPGCGTPNSGQSSGELASAEASTPAASTGEDVSEARRYVCARDHASFRIEDLQTAPQADARADPAAAVLGLVLGQSGLPVEGWRRVVDTANEVLFVVETPEDEAPYAFVSVVPGEVIEFGRDGWTADSYGACTPRPVVPNSQSVADWWIDPSVQRIGPDDRVISALVLENACASGRTAEGRILPPSVEYGAEVVVVTITVRSLSNADCPGHPPTPYTFELDEPLGERSLVDGGRFPPGDPTEPPP
jgi:hypothetical protein